MEHLIQILYMQFYINMKKLFFIIGLILFSIVSFSQVPKQIQGLGAKGTDVEVRDQITIDSALKLPKDTVKLSLKDTGALAYKNGQLFIWKKVNGILSWYNSFSTLSNEVDQGSTLNFLGTANDSIDNVSIVAFDTATHIYKDTSGVHLKRITNTTNAWDNRVIMSSYGHTWTNTFIQSITFTPNFSPSATVRSIGVGITVTGDLQIWPNVGGSTEYFGFVVKLGSDATTSGIQGVHYQTGNHYSQNFYSGLVWSMGDVLKLIMEEKDRNKFLITILNLSNGSKVTATLNYALPNNADANGFTIDAGYPSIFFNGGDFTVQKYSFDPISSGVQLVWIGNSIPYGWHIDSTRSNNNYYSTYNIIKDRLPFKSVLLARGGIATHDLYLVMKEILSYKPKYVVLDGIQNNDVFLKTCGVISPCDTLPSQKMYDSVVKKTKSNGITVIHIVPPPRSHGSLNFQYYQKNWLLRTYPLDMIVNDYDSLTVLGDLDLLNPIYTEDGVHLNVAGHALRARAFLRSAQFEFYQGSTTRSNPDTITTKLVGIGTTSPLYPLDVSGTTKTDTLLGSRTTRSLILWSNSINPNTGFVYLGRKSAYSDSIGTSTVNPFLGIGTNFYQGYNIHLYGKKAGTLYSTIQQDTSCTACSAAIRFIQGISTTITTDLRSTDMSYTIGGSKPGVFLINTSAPNGLVLCSQSSGDIMFGSSILASDTMWARFKNMHFLMHTATDNGRMFQINGTVTINKDSMPLLSSVTSQYLQLIDTADNGQLKRISVTNLIPHTIFTPSTGGTVTLVNNQYNIINPSGSLATLTINLPSSPANNDRVEMKFTRSVTTVTYAGGTYVSAVTSPTAAQDIVLVYDSATSSWY